MRSTLFHRVGLDAAIATLLFGAAYLCGTAYVRTAMAAGVVPDFYQVHFAPAVMVACGRGYVSPPSGEVPALDMFLATQRSTFECADLPAHPRLAKLTGPQVTWRYLISTAGLIWRATSVSWSELVLTFSGVLVAATVALAYALARLSVGRVLAIFVAGAVLSSPLHLTTLLYLRDYSKAPFLTALWVLLGALVAAPLSVGGTLASKRVLALAAVYGLVLAIGSGFRNDVLIAAPPFVLAIAFLPGGIFANFALKVEALAIAAATFLLAAWPLLGAYTAGGGASMQHVALLGLMANFNESLDVAPSVYELGHTYDDSLVTVIITNYAVRRQHVNEPIADYDHRYDMAASAVIRNVITTFPGDILARAYASAFTIATLPTSHFAEGRPPQFLPRGRIKA